MTRARGTIAAAGASGCALLLLVGCMPSDNNRGTDGGELMQNEAVLPDSHVKPLLAELTHDRAAKLPAMRLADGLAPPTNKWFSGLVFGDEPQPVFPLPLSFGLAENGFGFGVPEITTSEVTIAGGYNAAVAVDVAAPVFHEVTAYDDASVTIRQMDEAGEALGSLVIAAGSPLVSYTALGEVELDLGQPVTREGEGVWSLMAGGSEYGLVSDGEVGDESVALAEGEWAVWFAVPGQSSALELAPSVAPLASVALSYETGRDEVTTTLRYESAADGLVVARPHHAQYLREPSECELGSFPSVYGELVLCQGPTLSWSAPQLEPKASLDLGTLSDEQREQLAAEVKRDAAELQPLPADTYFGGKGLYRLANLLDLASQLGDDESAQVFQSALKEELLMWAQPDGCVQRDHRCFLYDQTARGIVGLVPSFGSDEFNDHHFHYGYFLYSASVAARHDPSLVEQLAPVIDLLAADIATSGSTSYFPERRVFDAYASHSWASGFAPFADGNNQESSSEAAMAWNGLALWADATGNTALKTEAVWMLSAEAASANSYWTNFDRSDPVYDGYGPSIVSLNWGGKRDYATWFSAEPNAKLAILALPMSPVSEYLGVDPERVTENVEEATPNGYEVQFGDFLLMYASLAGKDEAEEALATATELPDEFIDDGNSRSYLLAWIMSRG